MDYLGRIGTRTEMGHQLNISTDNNNNVDISSGLSMNNPLMVTYMEHPRTNEKLYVIEKPQVIICNMCDKKHETYCFTLEKGYQVFYCQNYQGGNWAFVK